jgi:hypothetical protein
MYGRAFKGGARGGGALRRDGRETRLTHSCRAYESSEMRRAASAASLSATAAVATLFSCAIDPV